MVFDSYRYQLWHFRLLSNSIIEDLPFYSSFDMETDWNCSALFSFFHVLTKKFSTSAVFLKFFFLMIDAVLPDRSIQKVYEKCQTDWWNLLLLNDDLWRGGISCRALLWQSPHSAPVKNWRWIAAVIIQLSLCYVSMTTT